MHPATRDTEEKLCSAEVIGKALGMEPIFLSSCSHHCSIDPGGTELYQVAGDIHLGQTLESWWV